MATPVNPFSSDRLVYRAYSSPHDDDFFHSVQSDPISMINSCSSIPRPQDRRFSDAICKHLLDNSLLFVVICLPSSKTVGESIGKSPSEEEPLTRIGTLFLKSASSDMAHHRNSELGIDIIRTYQGQGYGQEALQWTLNWAFKIAGLHRVELTVLGWNHRATRLYERLGFVLEGKKREHLFKDGIWWDEFQMGILDREWALRQT